MHCCVLNSAVTCRVMFHAQLASSGNVLVMNILNEPHNNTNHHVNRGTVDNFASRGTKMNEEHPSLSE